MNRNFKIWAAVLMTIAPLIGNAHAQVIISEFMAKNDTTLMDGDGIASDWIELYNSGTSAVDLTGWFLSDNSTNLTAWAFPSTTIASGDYLVVFASGQTTDDYVDGLGYLHTNFKLSGDGESVVLTQSDGVTVEHQIINYPDQSDDVAYGIPRDATYSTLVTSDEDATALIPESDAAGTDWHEATYDDNGWQTGYQGIGYETGTGYDSLIGLDVEAMRSVNASVYVRIPFEVSEANSIASLSLRTKYDDGFVAFLNGVEIARANAPTSLAWNSLATSSHEADLSSYENFDVSSFTSALREGTNMLAIHGLNTPANSSDMLILAELNAAVAGELQIDTLNYLPTPTPGVANVSGFLGYVGDTSFTVDRGFYTNAFDVEISCNTDGASIYYTIDGTTPTADNGTLYTDAITISRTTVLRATAFVAGYQPSNVDTQTYIFLSDIITQSADAGSLAPEWPSSSINGQAFDYAMDPDVVTDPDYADQIEDALLDIPSISIVTDPDNLFNSSSGIYVNAEDDGALWERKTSVELINPDGTDGFQINGGIRIRGGSSRKATNPKHSFRLFFRSEYGTSRLNYRLFGDEGADSFKRMDLRTGQNFSWQMGSSGAYSTWLYDIFTRDAHRSMGQPYTRGRFYHLYLNGQYWGLYQTEERPDARYGESYYGGDNDDYDVVKSGDSHGLIEATDGILDNYQDLWTAVNFGVSSDSAYFAIQGMNADGSKNESYTRLLDADNLIDYMLCVYYSGNRDSPIGPPGGGIEPRNLFASFNRNNPDGFKFIAHDGEHCLGYHLSAGVNYNHITDYSVLSSSTLSSQAYCNPWWLHLKLMENDEYALRFADHVHRHFFNDGILTPDKAAALVTARKTEMEMAIIAESARWGDYVTSSPRTKNDDWLPAVNNILNSYIQASPNTRTDVVFGQIEAQDWYPSVDAPEFNQHGGSIAARFSLSISGTGTIYFTTDGTDPREIGGAVAGKAYSSAITLNHSAQIKARILSDGAWSALTEATFVLNEASPLRITEIMYNPTSDLNYSSSDFEFIELLNTGTETIGLAGSKFTEGISFDFTDGNVSTVAPGEYVVLVNNYEAFTNRYDHWDAINIAGEYHGKFYLPSAALSDGGEQLVLVDGLGNTIQDFDYNDWYDTTDGEGFSLTLIDPTADTNTWSESTSWRASKYRGGTPGTGPEAFLAQGDLLINEVLTHQDTDDPGDWIELYNSSTNTIDVSGWFLSDDEEKLEKIELGTLNPIAPAGYLVLTEADHFGTTAAGTNGFALSELGENIYLSSGEDSEVTGFRIEEHFGAADRDVTFGRHVKSDGSVDFTAQSTATYGAANAYPRVDPVIVSEIMYHPADSNAFEYIEICNTASTNVPLYNTTTPTNTWQFDGAVEYSFPVGTILTPGGCIVITETDEATFRSYYSVGAGVTVLGPYDGQLNNSGEDLQLTKPGDPESDEVPAILVELVEYSDEAPWPTDPDGLGTALERLDTALYPNDATSWTTNAPSPGTFGGVTNPDTDNDGMPDSWEIDHFGSIDATNGGPDEDWDNDGTTNLDEYLAGTSPTDDMSQFLITSNTSTPDYVLTWTSVTGKTYSVWSTTNLLETYTLSESAIPATPPENTHTSIVERAECTFFRISVD